MVTKQKKENTTVNRVILSKAIGIANKAVSASPVIPLLGNLLLEVENGSSRVAGTNFEVGISCSFPSDGKEFKTCVPAKTFVSLIDVLQSEEVEIKLNDVDQSAIIMTESSTSNIKCAPADEFPDIPKVTKAQLKIPVDQFKEMIGRVAFCSSQETDVPLAGVQLLMEGNLFIMFATDGYHLSYEEYGMKKAGKFEALVKGTTLEMISRILPDEGELHIQATENKIMFHCDNLDIVTQLLDGKYPDYKLLKKAIGKAKTTIILSTIELFRACRQLKVFAVDGNNKTKLDISGMLVRYSIETQERGDADVTLPSVKKGNDITIGINVKLLYEFLEVCKTQQTIIEMSSNESAIVFKMEGIKTFYHMIMPVTL